MKRICLTVVTFSLMLVSVNDVSACGYGLFDPDVETYSSGDPVQSRKALAKLLLRGPKALTEVRFYRQDAIETMGYQKAYLQRLEASDPALKLQPEVIETETRRTRKWLEWNEMRLRKLDHLLFRLGDGPFALMRPPSWLAGFRVSLQ
jgi:hypothetical protein